jgi:hypothetical protein
MMRKLSIRKKSVNRSPPRFAPLRIAAVSHPIIKKLSQDEENEKNIGNTKNVWSVNVPEANPNNPNHIGNNWDPVRKNYKPGRGYSTGRNLSWANKQFPPSSYISPTRKRARSVNRNRRPNGTLNRRPNGTLKRVRHSMNERN